MPFKLREKLNIGKEVRGGGVFWFEFAENMELI